MSHNSNNLTIKFNIKEIFYINLGSTWTLDSLYLFLIGPLGLTGFILNLISFNQFNKIKMSGNGSNLMIRQRKKSFQNYLRMYTFYCFIICFIFSFCAIFRTPRYFNLTQNVWASVYNCKIISWLAVNIFFVINILDCVLLVERVSLLTKRFDKFARLDSFKINICIFFGCNLLNLPGYFLYDVKSNEDFQKAAENIHDTINFKYYSTNPFFLSLSGRIIIIVLVFIKDILSLVVEILLSIVLIILFKNYLTNKKTLITSSKNKFSNQDQDQQEQQSDSLMVQLNNKLPNKLDKLNLKLIKMTIFISICSIMSHLVLVLCYVIYLIDDTSFLARYASFTGILFVLFKYISNFFFFYKIF
jgi:hypothetical protein